VNAARTRALYALDPWLLPPVVWGGAELQKSFGKPAPRDARLGESWEVSCISGRESTLRGETATLAAAFEADPAHFLAGGGSAPAEFPLLVKLLSTSDVLSVQVHPNDEQAARLEGSPAGKHEAWVVLHADAGARVFAGLRPGATADALFDAAGSGNAARVLGILGLHEVAAGDVVEVPPGCVHAPGPGLVLYEVQQPVDLTYRIYDWGRLGLDGKPRPLHVDKARQVLDPAAQPRIARGLAGSAAGFERTRLVSTRAFGVERWRCRGRQRAEAGELLLATCAGGIGALSAGGDRVDLDRGRSCVIPAATRSVDLEGEDLVLLVASRS
jgi:mannose-6-phosphate isomerase